MPQQTIKILSDIRIVSSRLELDSQALDRNDVKMVFIQRPRKSIKDNAVDPGDCSFDVEDPKKIKSYNRRKSFDESHYFKLLDGNQAESETEVTENVSAPYCQTLPSKEGAPEKVNFMQKNTINKSKSSIEDLVEEECIDLVVIEEDEDQLNLSHKNETLHYRETFTPVALSNSTDGNIIDVSNGQNKTRDLDNRGQITLVEKVQDSPNNRKTVTTTDQTCPKVVWVSNVSHNTSASQLKDALSAHGNVIGAKVVVNARYPGSSCYGYVTMASNEDVDNVIAKLNNTELNGQIIKLGRKLNDKLTTKTKNEVANENQGKKAVSERELQQSRSIERSRSMGKSGPWEGSYSSEPFKRRRSRSPSRKSGILTFAQIKEERERQKLREQERALREASRRRQEEIVRQKNIDRRQRQEAMRLEREKEKLRLEKEKIVREREELMKLEQQRYKITQEKLELEKTLSRLEEGGLERPAPHWVRGRKRFATGNRHFEAATPPKFDYSASKTNSTSTWKLYGSSKNNCGKIRPYDGGTYYNKKSRNYNGPSGSTSSKYLDDRKPYDYQNRTLPHRPKQNSGNVKQWNIHNMYEESKRNDLGYNETKSILFDPPAAPKWPTTLDKSD